MRGIEFELLSSDISTSCTHSLFMTVVTPLTASFREDLSRGATGFLGTGGLFSRGYIEVFPKF